MVFSRLGDHSSVIIFSRTVTLGRRLAAYFDGVAALLLSSDVMIHYYLFDELMTRCQRIAVRCCCWCWYSGGSDTLRHATLFKQFLSVAAPLCCLLFVVIILFSAYVARHRYCCASH